MVLQVVCDADLRFINVFFGSPGVRQDGRIYDNSAARPRLTALSESGNTLQFGNRRLPPQVLADSAYSGTNTVMKPYLQNTANGSRHARRFNLRHCKARQLVELAIGVLKVRWRILLFTMQAWAFKNIKYIVHACVILHNLCVEDGTAQVSADLYGGAAAVYAQRYGGLVRLRGSTSPGGTERAHDANRTALKEWFQEVAEREGHDEPLLDRFMAAAQAN